jgi:hypothetical protein
LPGQLGTNEVRVLVSLLEPVHTIKSIVNLFRHKPVADLYAEPAQATRYYIERLQALAEFGTAHAHAYYYYDAGLFQQQPEALLARLTQWLTLDSVLREEYQLFSQTGQAGKGDSSPLIQRGRIERTPIDYSHVEIPADLLQRAQRVYIECRQRIIAHAIDALTL